jgi:hypothetical protein
VINLFLSNPNKFNFKLDKQFSSFIGNSLKVNFQYLTSNLFNLFFNNSFIEVPKVLLPLKALTSPKNQINIYKLNNYLTLHGSFIKSLIKLNTA